MKKSIKTNTRTEMIDITNLVQDAIEKEQFTDGICVVYVPHTTCGVTINENADGDVKTDIINTLNKIVPYDGNYRHIEGNSDAHVKASMMGSSVTCLVENGRLVLGTWQGIFFTEFDGPRTRNIIIKLV